MVFQFQSWQLDELESRLAIAADTNNYTPVYDWIFFQISDNAGTGM